ncbi:hypothetical protein CEXT_208051 [Caerostris extrusa]|uniref:Uncharacterized protein n=1 Tax=Caerostris extrusa TaxID=172846 RepID=A0AAV4W4M5_CAEEX|nr:hypothetical protein CEXT_208051 [Caerostris extrusa]
MPSISKLRACLADGSINKKKEVLQQQKTGIINLLRLKKDSPLHASRNKGDGICRKRETLRGVPTYRYRFLPRPGFLSGTLFYRLNWMPFWSSLGRNIFLGRFSYTVTPFVYVLM